MREAEHMQWSKGYGHVQKETSCLKGDGDALTGDRICRKEFSHGEVDAIQCASFRIVRLSGAARLVVCMAAIV
jgi:hypothetical protein